MDNLLAAVLMVGILIFIHEFGHFIVAKACGIGAPVFSFGFGRRLFGFQWRGTDYRLSLLPFGGYVRMTGADPYAYGEADEEDDEYAAPSDPAKNFTAHPIWHRLSVVAAGPLFNLGLPFVVFTVLLMAGEPQLGSQIGGVTDGQLAAQAGLRPGDTVVSIDATPIQTWDQLGLAVSALEPGPHSVVVDRWGQRRTLDLPVPAGQSWTLGITRVRPTAVVGVDDPSSPVARAGIKSGDVITQIDDLQVHDWIDIERGFSQAGAVVRVELEGESQPHIVQADPSWHPLSAGRPLSVAEGWGVVSGALVVGSVSTTVEDAGLFSGCNPHVGENPGPAAMAGVQAGDRFLLIDGQPVRVWQDVLNGIAATMQGEGEDATSRAVDLAMVRQGRVIHLTMTPKVVEDTDVTGEYYRRPMIGVAGLGGNTIGPEVRVYYPPLKAFRRASDETVMIVGMIVERLGQLLTGEAALDKSLGGPIEIVRQAGMAAERGVFAWARMLGMLSISLGIVNLVPVPVLDGGQLLFLALEAVRGRPVSVTFRERALQIGVIFIVVLFLSVMVFDIQRLFESWGTQ